MLMLSISLIIQSSINTQNIYKLIFILFVKRSLVDMCMILMFSLIFILVISLPKAFQYSSFWIFAIVSTCIYLYLFFICCIIWYDLENIFAILLYTTPLCIYLKYIIESGQGSYSLNEDNNVINKILYFYIFKKSVCKIFEMSLLNFITLLLDLQIFGI